MYILLFQERNLTFLQVQIDAPRLRLGVLGDTKANRIDVLLQFNGRILIVRNHDNAYGGMVSGTAAETIAKLTESFPLTLVGYLILSMAKMKAPRNFTFHIAIYGNRQDANAIGTLLGASGLYIQPPHGFQSKVPYFNPQYLRRPGDEDYIAYFSPQFSTTLSTTFSEDDPLRYQVLEVFNNAHGPSIYTSVKPSPRLKTPLKE